MCWGKGKHKVVIKVIFSRAAVVLCALFMCQCLVAVHQDAHSFSSHFIFKNNFACNYLFCILRKHCYKRIFYGGKNIITSQ